MQLALIDNGQVVKIDHYKSLFPNVSFPTTGPDADFLQANSAIEVTVWKPFDAATEKLVSVTPYIEGNYVYTVAVEAKTKEEIASDAQSTLARKNAQTVSMRQARIALSRQGILDDVETALGLLEGDTGKEARITWEYATEVQRGDTFVQGISSVLNLTETQLDQLFELASSL